MHTYIIIFFITLHLTLFSLNGMDDTTLQGERTGIAARSIDAQGTATILDIATHKNSQRCLQFFQTLIHMAKAPECTWETIICYSTQKQQTAGISQKAISSLDLPTESAKSWDLYDKVRAQLATLYTLESEQTQSTHDAAQCIEQMRRK